MPAGVAVGRVSNSLDGPALALLERALDAFDPRTRHRGRAYWRERRIRDVVVGTDTVTAAVDGNETYAVAWRFGGRAWTPSCTCPVAPWCKHAYAVAWSLVRERRSQPPVSRPGDAAPAPLLRPLLKASTPWQRQEALHRLLGPYVGYELGLHDRGGRDLLTQPDPEVVCWRLAHLLDGRARGALAAALAPYRHRPDLEARYAAAAAAAVRRDLVAWAERPRPAGERRLRLVLELHVVDNDRIRANIQPRVSSVRLDDAPRTPQQLQQLRNEIRAHPDLMPPAETALLATLTSAAGYGPPASLVDLVERFADASVIWWSDDVPPEVARYGVVAGTPVRLRPEPARLLPWCAERGGEPWLELRFVWPDGSSCAADEALRFEPAAGGYGADGAQLVLADGVFSRLVEVPPAEIWNQLRGRGVPVPPAERADVLGRLAARFRHVAETLAVHTRVHPVQPVVVLELGDDGWLALRVLAPTAAGWTPDRPLPEAAVAFEYAPPGRWTRAAVGAQRGLMSLVDAPVAPPAPATPAEGDAWLEVPEPAAVGPVAEWLAAFTEVKSARDGRPGWWLHATGRRLDALADAWERRPPGVAFFGNERLRRLLAAPRVAARVRVRTSGIDWLAVSAEWEAEGRALTDADLAALRAAAGRFVRLPSSGEWVRRDVADAHDEGARVLADLGLEAGAGEERVTLWQLAGASAESLAALERLGADAETVAAVRELRGRVAAFAGLPRVEPPDGLRGTLRPYQRTGLDFLAHASSLGVGAILADDMGLGKTVQALAWLAHLRATDPDGGPSLVVCPASVMGNWAREAARFVPGLRVLVLARGRERHALRAALAEHDLLVTNYALLRRDAEEWAKVELRAAILDEAQNVKNPDAAVTRAALGLRARHRLALTGTPLENRPLDLWSIASFTTPGYLGTRAAFSARFDRADAPPHVRALLAAKLRPVLLRRLKRDVAPDLPERIEERRDCDLTPAQRKLYLAELRRSRTLLERLADDAAMARNKINILAALTRLRQLCCHPALGDGRPELGSGKFDALFELLDPLLAEGHKVLLFSQFVRCLDLLAGEMTERGIRHHVLTGATVRRDEVVARFADDPSACVFLLSLKAGGTGLNLTAASYVVLFDPWWNPAVEAQAIDRTHRIGQDRTVIAYRLVARGTIEERIVELQARKAAMVRDVLGEDGFARALTREDLGYLLGDDAE